MFLLAAIRAVDDFAVGQHAIDVEDNALNGSS
jgi:hypothetical protein